jgi:hypothetical protein
MSGHETSEELQGTVPSCLDLTHCSPVEVGSNPTRTCRGPAALANEAGVAGVEPHPAVELVPTLPGPTNVVLAGRATTVPFTAVLTGPERTITGNATAASTCAVPCRRRWRSGPIWLCKQEVTGSNLAVPTTSYGCLADGTTHKRAVLSIL